MYAEKFMDLLRGNIRPIYSKYLVAASGSAMLLTEIITAAYSAWHMGKSNHHWEA